jgi:hypothetical protein
VRAPVYVMSCVPVSACTQGILFGRPAGALCLVVCPLETGLEMLNEFWVLFYTEGGFGPPSTLPGATVPPLERSEQGEGGWGGRRGYTGTSVVW